MSTVTGSAAFWCVLGQIPPSRKLLRARSPDVGSDPWLGLRQSHLDVESLLVLKTSAVCRSNSLLLIPSEFRKWQPVSWVRDRYAASDERCVGMRDNNRQAYLLHSELGQARQNFPSMTIFIEPRRQFSWVPAAICKNLGIVNASACVSNSFMAYICAA